MTFFMQRHENPDGIVLAACDAVLLGETFTDGDIRLHVDESFYGGAEASLAEVQEALDGVDTANLVGTDLVTALVAADAVDAAAVMTVDGVQHVQLVFI